ncbi:MAG TPA: YggS family pyridoxal phosphate-dependent enzyme [Bacteroidales bacterium]|jgi:pyridoxal phosphate enzyme (YggS family)|nr:YggS family pyridoxal phosphate-dependent enzyme [Bacteroidales bacterium]HKM12378.1 YggS family pyridoxal phosphate-dependent enzyme [Bacteroidales bacterium]HPB88632.1 YggS family pyridoxal phosphate-dependent enzyme [Bacteroidales bacterium]HPY21371.1 YggS family pyridoxal phosphate-dependent enzyme [Bacteroidales bacterium]HQA92543.1 YggS family pyridoxal phosphate-dependent enzyme [Bacteroidales bacterium]
MTIRERIESILSQLPSTVKLVAVSKLQSVPEILEAYAAGQRAFGENRPQELAAKVHSLPEDIEWHFIGRLQSNKIKMILPYVSLIHSVDSERLLERIDRQAALSGRVVDCLIQLHIAIEDTKQGFPVNEALEQVPFFRDRYKNVRIRGLMGMASFVEDMEQVRGEFRTLKSAFDKLKPEFPKFDTLSMGMSHDWQIAVEEGATIVRIGSIIFGPRCY